jgi:hypothetical protein
MLQPLQHPFYSTLLLSQPAMRLIRNMAMLMPLGVHAVRWLWRVVCAIKPTAVVARLLSVPCDGFDVSRRLLAFGLDAHASTRRICAQRPLLRVCGLCLSPCVLSMSKRSSKV